MNAASVRYLCFIAESELSETCLGWLRDGSVLPGDVIPGFDVHCRNALRLANSNPDSEEAVVQLVEACVSHDWSLSLADAKTLEGFTPVWTDGELSWRKAGAVIVPASGGYYHGPFASWAPTVAEALGPSPR